jgi:hypothetical protein
MPETPKQGKTARRANRKGRGENIAAGAAGSIMQRVSPFPPTRTATFRYADVALESEASNAGTYQLFDLGSLYDPDYTGIGHQPLYFDQLVTLNGPYKRYRVTHGVVRFTVLNMSTTVPIQVTAALQPYVTTPGNRIAAAEKPFVMKKNVMPQGSSNALATFVVPFKSAKVVGVTPAQFLTEDDYAGNYGGSPALSAKLLISMFGIGANCSCFVDYEIEQTAVLFDLGFIGQS